MDVNPMDPIEAYHPEYPSYGVHPAQYSFGPRGHRVRFNGGEHILEPNGHLPYSGWRIRNVQPVVAKPAISDELVERMVTFLRKLDKWDGSYALASDMTEARAIVAKLPQPVDPDLLEARAIEARICREVENSRDAERVERGEFDERPGMQGVLAAIKRGRALERGEP